jgi:6-pyruvoyltetrahydropterin/6-carboxytetrahydropterin synthase
MAILIRRRYDLEVAHLLTAGVPEGHKCRRLHGHRYELTLHVGGELNADGMLIEYDDLDRVIRPVLRAVDHHSLNTLAERCSTPTAAWVAENPTVERFAAWLAVRLESLIASAAPDRRLWLDRIDLQEDATSGASWRP